MKYAILDIMGIPTTLAETGGAAPAGALVLPATADLVELSRQHLVDGAWEPRPVAVLTLTGMAPATVTVTAGPLDTPVRVYDIDGAELLFEGLASPGAFWTFVDPGRYAVEVEPPAPWLPATLRFEVPA